MTRQGRSPYAGESFHRIHAAITSSLLRHDPLVVITGESGIGKTTSCRAGIASADPAVLSTIANPFLTFRDLLKQVLSDFDPARNSIVQEEDDESLFATEPDLLRSILQVVRLKPDRPAVIVIDDAHMVNLAVLGQLRALVDLSGDGQPLTVMLVGQPEITRRLGRPMCQGVQERVAQTCLVGPLRGSELRPYLAHNYPEMSVPVTPDAVSALMTFSGGVPATLNRLFETAATIASNDALGTIDRKVVRNAADRLRDPRSTGPRRSWRAAQIAAATTIVLAIVLAAGWLVRSRAASTITARPEPERPAADRAAMPAAPARDIQVTPPAPQVDPSPSTAPLEVATPPEAPSTLSPPPPAPVSATPRSAPQEPRRQNVSPPAGDIDSQYALLRRNVEGRASRLADLGDVKGVIALREATVRRDRELGQVRPAVAAELLIQLDAKLDQARLVRLRLDAEEFRRAAQAPQSRGRR